jgi:REP element-mobilizing transposase RayT
MFSVRNESLARLAAGGTPALGEPAMIIAYHAIFTTYGTWLPNDPRGSYSKRVYSQALAELGAIRYGPQCPQPSRTAFRRFRTAIIPRLSRPPYYVNGGARPVIAAAFGVVLKRLSVRCVACAIMNDHVHMVVLRSEYRIEYVVNQLKGAATHALELPRTPWTRGQWKVFLDDNESLAAAARYVEANPAAAGLTPQRWSFVVPPEILAKEPGSVLLDS